MAYFCLFRPKGLQKESFLFTLSVVICLVGDADGNVVLLAGREGWDVVIRVFAQASPCKWLFEPKTNSTFGGILNSPQSELTGSVVLWFPLVPFVAPFR